MKSIGARRSYSGRYSFAFRILFRARSAIGQCGFCEAIAEGGDFRQLLFVNLDIPNERSRL
jgi:hypothetical protein